MAANLEWHDLDLKKVQKSQKNAKKSIRHPCLKISLFNQLKDSWATYLFVQQFYEDFFPYKSQYEKTN